MMSQPLVAQDMIVVSEMGEQWSPKIEPPKITVNSLDEEWMENALAVVKKHLSEDKFSTDIFAREMMAYLFFCVKYERNLAFSYIKLYLCLRISYVQRR